MNSCNSAYGSPVTLILLFPAIVLFCGFAVAWFAGFDNASHFAMNISGEITPVWVNALIRLLNGLGVIVISILFYVVSQVHSMLAAIMDLGGWLTEAVTLIVGKTGIFTLISVVLKFV